MTDYGKKKCELLEEKGFKANGYAYWVENEDAEHRTYSYVKKEVGSEVKTITIVIDDEVKLMDEFYGRIKEQMAEIKEYNTEDGNADGIATYYADYEWMFSNIEENAKAIQVLNWRAYLVNCDEPWDEVDGIFRLNEDEDGIYTENWTDKF